MAQFLEKERAANQVIVLLINFPSLLLEKFSTGQN